MVIGYFSTATVFAAALGLGYLWRSDILNDEKVFRIVAIVQDVDVDAIGREDEVERVETPGEEPSLAQIERVRAIALRNFEAKENALNRGGGEFKHLLSQLNDARERFDSMARELDERIRRERDLENEKSVAAIVRDLKSVKPEQAKELLLRNLEGAGADPDARRKALGDVVRLMNAMPTNTLKGILKRFQSQEELDRLHEIHNLLLEGGPQKEVLDQALQRLNNREF